MRSSLASLALITLLAAAGCSDRTRGERITSTDAGAAGDAAFPADGAAGWDAGPLPLPDGGAATDAGSPSDAGGGGTDAGPAPIDAGPPPSCDDHDLASALGEAIASGSTAGGTSAVAASCGSGGGPGLHYLWTAPTAGTFTIDTNGSGYDTVLSVRSGRLCSGGELACDDDGGEGTRSRVRLTLTAGQELVISVQGYSGATGSFVLNVHEGIPDTETSCTDGVDDDRDGDVDCDDYDCDSHPACTEVDCANGVDDDGDGDIDCDDYDCYSDPACTEVDCANGVDDDGDGDIDCDDYDCSGDAACGESVCTDGIDNDADGYTDCADSECRCDAACLGADPCYDADLGSTVGASAATGTVPDRCGHRTGSCGGNGREVSYRFTATTAGAHTIDTYGSSYDTVLYVHDGSCAGPELACNDDTSGVQSEVTVTLTAGQTIIIVVDAYSAWASGTHTLNITAP